MKPVRHHHLRVATATAAAAFGAMLLCAAPAAFARDVNVRSFDGVTIRAHFSPASDRAADERVPTVLIGPGYPTQGDMNPTATRATRSASAPCARRATTR